MARSGNGVRLPKRVAGFKLSKRTRLLGTPGSKALLGAVVAAVAGAMARRSGTARK